MTIIHHSNFGVWDLYQEEKKHATLSQSTHFYHALPFLYKMIKDILSIPSCSFYLSAYICVELFSSLLPAISLWFSGQLLSIVQAAVDTRSIDTRLLIRVAAGRFLCQAATRISRHAKSRLTHPLNSRIKQYYSVHTFRAIARLDAPTFDDSAVQRQLEESLSPNSRSTIAWDAVTTVLHILATLIQLTSQLSVLISVLRHQRDGPLLALLSFAHSLYEWYSSTSPFIKPGGMYLLFFLLSANSSFSLGSNNQRPRLHQKRGSQTHCHRPCTSQRNRRRWNVRPSHSRVQSGDGCSRRSSR